LENRVQKGNAKHGGSRREVIRGGGGERFGVSTGRKWRTAVVLSFFGLWSPCTPGYSGTYTITCRIIWTDTKDFRLRKLRTAGSNEEENEFEAGERGRSREIQEIEEWGGRDDWVRKRGDERF
jgi:hypothetical protein